MRRALNPYVVLGILACLASLLFAADFWESQAPGRWSERQCLKLLRDSPWVRDEVVTRVSRVSPMSHPAALPTRSTFGNGEFGQSTGTAGDLGTGSIGDREVTNTFRVVFRSAQPIRLAAERLDALTGTDRTQSGTVAGTDPAEYVCVEISYFSNPPGHNSLVDVDSFFRRATVETLRNQTYLADKSLDVTIPLEAYRPPSDQEPAARFLFPRYDESGKPFFDESTKTILFHSELDIRGPNGSGSGGRNLQFRYSPDYTDPGAASNTVIDLKFKAGKMKFKGRLSI